MPKETTFHRELINDLVADGVTLHKVPDAPVSYSQKDDGSKIRFSPKKIVDLVGVGPLTEIRTAGGPFVVPWAPPLFWECKMMTGLNSFPLSRIDQNQLKILSDIADRASAIFIVNYRVKKYSDRSVDKLGLRGMVDHKRINALTVLLPHDILNAILTERKSIPIADLAQSFVSRPWGKRWTYRGIKTAVWKPKNG